jgi:hypothetical protein
MITSQLTGTDQQWELCALCGLEISKDEGAQYAKQENQAWQ